MNKEQEVKESIEFCNDIYLYYEQQDNPHASYKDSVSYQKRNTNNFVEKTSNREQTLDDVDMTLDQNAIEYSDFKKELFYLLLCVVLAFFTAKLISSYVIQITTVHGDSMETTISDSDRLFVGKLDYKFADPERFDVIVLSKDGEINLIKRIIGLPGEKIEIKKGIIYVNGEKLKEHYGLDPMNPEADPVAVELKEDEYFVLGDNRLVSLDSRSPSIGPIKREDILGKALARIYPLSKIGTLVEKGDS